MPVFSKPVVEHDVYDVDEDEFAAQQAGSGRADRPQKRGRADSSPLSDTTSQAGDGSEDGEAEIERDRRRDKTKYKRMKKAPELELEEMINRIKSSKSKAYEKFNDPIIDWKNTPPTHYMFTCKGCGKHVPRRIGVSETSGLLSHTNKCRAENKQSNLQEHGITGASTQLTQEDVREYFALWVAEDGQPNRIVGDRYLRKLISPQCHGYIPHRETVARDIKVIYNATQAEITARLAELTGTFHIALDMFQADNGYDFMGIVLFHQGLAKDKSPTINRFLLECLTFGGESHTGLALANAVYDVLCKFKIQDRVWAVVCDNASNNAKMMEHLADYGLNRLTGPRDRVFCMLHVINLAAKAIASEFRKKQPKSHDDDEDNDDEEQYEVIDFENDTEVDLEDIDEDDVEHAASCALAGDEEDPFVNIELPVLESGTPEAIESVRVGTILVKTAKFAHKVRYSAKAKKVFKEACVEKDVETPHNVRRDQKTRWNLTGNMSSDAKRTFPAIVAAQQDPRLAIPRSQRLVMDDLKYLNGLITLLEPLKAVTDILSRGGVPMLADVLVHFDALDYIYTTICADEKQPAWMRHAAKRALTVLNKHYGKTDESHQYRLAVLFHPSMRVHYLKQADWPQDWIDATVDLAVGTYEKFYNPAGVSNTQAPAKAPSTSQFAYSSYMSQLYKTVASAERTAATCPVCEFVNGAVVFDYGEKGEPVFRNPLAWWYNQHVAGNEWNGLTQMALDVLSIPGTSP
ncbi:hypothetical protein FS749_007151 [Ceratobasidium sp. UAMH 11750]|nr:hypothetical protein FS749_007151 [Ceratobasidium sp. UAMH 11750]